MVIVKWIATVFGHGIRTVCVCRSPPPIPFGVQSQGFIIHGPGCPPWSPPPPVVGPFFCPPYFNPQFGYGPPMNPGPMNFPPPLVPYNVANWLDYSNSNFTTSVTLCTHTIHQHTFSGHTHTSYCAGSAHHQHITCSQLSPSLALTSLHHYIVIYTVLYIALCIRHTVCWVLVLTADIYFTWTSGLYVMSLPVLCTLLV